MITWYRCGQSTFSSCHHVATQRKAKMDKSATGQKPQGSESRQIKPTKMRKYFKDSNNQGIRSHDHMIQVWTINILVMPSRGHTEKSKNQKKHHRTKAPKDQNQGGQNPEKGENILRLQQSRRTIPWSQDTGVDNQHSRHAITWPHREKQKWTKAPQVENPKGSESRRTKPPKMRKYFKTPRIKVYDPMTTGYRCGQSTFSSCHHVATQRKAKMDKSTTGQSPKGSELRRTKPPKMRKIF